MNKIALAFSCCLLVTSCARHEVMTNTYLASPSLHDTVGPSSTFAVIPNTDVPNPIFDQTVKEKIEFMLENKGYKIAAPTTADYLLQYNYSMEGEAAMRQMVIPRSRSFYTRRSRFYDPFWDSGFGYPAYISEPYTLYLTKLRLTVSGKDPLTGERKALWVGETLAESLNPDMRSLIDYLMAASFRYFMKDTGKNETVVLDDDNRIIESLRKRSSPRALETSKSPAYTVPGV